MPDEGRAQHYHMVEKPNMNRRRMSVSASRKIYTYAYLRSAAALALEQGERAREGSFFNFMTSIILSAFCFEAYLNHVGVLDLPYWNAIEKKLSPEEKLTILNHELELGVDLSRQPFQSLRAITRFRNALAHGKTTQLKTQSVRFRAAGERIKYPQADWEKECTSKMARKYLVDVESMIKQIHKKAGHSGLPLATLHLADYSAVELLY